MAYLNKKLLFSQAGYSLVELLLAIAIFGVLVTTLFSGFIATREGKPQQEQRFTAVALFQESVEALRIIREQGWVNVATNGTYHPEKTPQPNPTTWSLAAGAETIGLFTRTIEIDDVYRNAGGDIVSVGGTLDPSSKAVTITIAWDQPLVSSYSRTIYLTRYLDNLAFIHTLDTDFNQSGHLASNVVFTTDSGGEVKLGPAGPGRGNWCTPSIVGQLDLPKNGSARAVTAVQGKVFSGTGENASGVSLAYVTVTDAVPPVTTQAGTFDGYKTNDVFGTNTYGFLATDNNSKEVVIVNLNNPMTQAGYYNITGNANAQSIFVSGNVGYVISGSTLFTFNLATINGNSSQSNLGSISLSGNGKSVYVVGSVAYVAIDSTTNQLQLINVGNPSSLSSLSTLTLNAAEGRDVYVAPDSERAYVATKGDVSKAEFFIVNIENKAAPSVVSSYDTNGMDPQAVDMVLDGHRAVIVGTGGEEYQVVTIAPENNPVRCGGINDDTGIYDISTVVEGDTDAYAYINTGQANSELKIIEGGPGGSYSLTGEYTSAPFNSGSTTAFNRLSFTTTVPANTTLRFQVAGAPVGTTCSDATYNFVGPDGTSSSYFTTSPNALPFNSTPGSYNNPARCFKYKAFFDTTNITVTPVLEEVTVNYSP